MPGFALERGLIKHVGLNDELRLQRRVMRIISPGRFSCRVLSILTITSTRPFTRNLLAAQNNNLFPWLQAQYRIWARTTEKASRGSTLIGLAELALSGCTTVFDHT